MNIPKHPTLRVLFLVYVAAWIIVQIAVPSAREWGVGTQLLSVFGVLLVVQIADFELNLRKETPSRPEKAIDPLTVTRPLPYVFACLMYGVTMLVAVSNIRDGHVEGGICIIAIIHYFLIYFVWVGLRSRRVS